MEAYLRNYGYHFSKKMYEWAVSMMKDRNKQPVKTMERDEFKTLLANNGINVEFQGYDGPYVYAMAKADFFGSSLPNEMSVLKFVSDALASDQAHHLNDAVVLDAKSNQFDLFLFHCSIVL